MSAESIYIARLARIVAELEAIGEDAATDLNDPEFDDLLGAAAQNIEDAARRLRQ